MPKSSARGISGLVAVLCVCLSGIVGLPAAKQANQASQRPTFRGGAVFVRADVFATKDGAPVTDLTANDLEIKEDGAVQSIATFEHVTVASGAGPSSRVEPRTAGEMRDMAGDPRSRLFLVFLDKPHLRMSSGRLVVRPLSALLRSLIWDDDIVGIMTPEMSALDVVLTRRTDRLAAWLQSVNAWEVGTSSRVIANDPVEDAYKGCFSDRVVRPLEISDVALEMIQRRREKRTLDALTDLVRYVGGLRDERKAVLLVSEGYRLFRRDPGLVRAALADTNEDGSPRARRWSPWCAAEVVKLADLDNERLFHDLLGEANHANVSFYPIDPRGLAVFDSEMGPAAPPPVDIDMRHARDRQEALELAARLTDGRAVITNDLDAGLRRVRADLSSYYLVGYASTNTRFDGRFRAISVRSKRPGVEIRARRGYRVPEAAEIARAAAVAPPGIDESTAAVERAVATLAGVSAALPVRVRASTVWVTAPATPADQPGPSGSALWVYGEVDVTGAGRHEWARGGKAEVVVSADSGEFVWSQTGSLGPGGSFAARFPQAAADAPLSPGRCSIRVRATPASGGSPVAAVLQVELPAPPADGMLALGEATYSRRGQTTGNRDVLTADLRFRRTERIVVELSTSLKPDSVSAEVLDRSGKPLALPAAASLVDKDGATWVRGELALASLAVGDYVLRLSATRGSDTRQVLAPFKVVP